jgi:uncharacterized membrane protein YphA (DoxX/SURF4 family)
VSSRALNIATWVASALLCALYLFASYGKLTSDPQMVEGFRSWGYSDSFRFFIGTCEFLGGIALLIPRLAFWSACGLVVIMLGAVYTLISHGLLNQSPPPFVALALLVFIITQRRKQALLLS